ADARIATAPTPSESIERPMSAVRTPQMMRRMPTKSTWADTDGKTGRSGSGTNRDAHFDADRPGVRRAQPEPERRAVCDAGRQRHAHRVTEQRVAGAEAASARLGPGFAAAAATRTSAADRHVERHDHAAARFLLGQTDL